MRIFLLYSAAVMLLTACGQDQPQQQAQQIPQQYQETPRSISGEERDVGPNPHAQLSSEQHISVALQHVENGRIEEALDVLTRAIAASPNDPSLIGTRGSFLLAQDRVFEALVDLEKAVTLAPGSAELLVNRSQAYSKFNRPQEAMADLDKAVAISPKLIPARFNRGVMLYDQARYQEALTDFDACIQTDPQTAGPYFNRAVTRDALGDHAGAVSDMKRFIELADNPEWKKVAQDTLAAWEKQGN